MKKKLMLIGIALTLHKHTKGTQHSQVFWAEVSHSTQRKYIDIQDINDEDTYRNTYILPLTHERVLVIPQDFKQINHASWKNKVAREVTASNDLKKAGLLTHNAKKINLYSHKNSKNNCGIALTHLSLTSLDKKGLYIKTILHKIPGSLGPKPSKKIFKEQLDIHNIDNWLPAINPLEKDLACLFHNQLSYLLDEHDIQYALVQQATHSTNYVIRFFGFDLSTKQNFHSPSLHTSPHQPAHHFDISYRCLAKKKMLARYENLLYNIVENLLNQSYHSLTSKNPSIPFMDEKYKELHHALAMHCHAFAKKLTSSMPEYTSNTHSLHDNIHERKENVIPSMYEEKEKGATQEKKAFSHPYKKSMALIIFSLCVANTLYIRLLYKKKDKVKNST